MINIFYEYHSTTFMSKFKCILQVYTYNYQIIQVFHNYFADEIQINCNIVQKVKNGEIDLELEKPVSKRNITTGTGGKQTKGGRSQKETTGRC